jgi:hypothetical protein
MNMWEQMGARGADEVNENTSVVLCKRCSVRDAVFTHERGKELI